MKRGVYVDALDQEIVSLDVLSFTELQQRFQKLYKQPPPKRIGRKLLILAIAFELQRKAYGIRVDRLQTRVLATNAGKSTRRGSSKSKPAAEHRSLRSGGRLVREWRGRQFEVYVAENGCYLDGTRYSSLSAAAEAITGVKRNGPAFFGLRSPRISP